MVSPTPLLEEFEFDSSKKANQCTKTKKAAFVMLILSMTIGLIWISIKLTTSKSQAKILYIYTSTEATQPYMKAQVIDVNNQAFKCDSMEILAPLCAGLTRPLLVTFCVTLPSFKGSAW